MKFTHKQVKDSLSSKKIAIIGFGLEGKSSYKFIRSIDKKSPVSIYDNADLEESFFNKDDHVSLFAKSKLKKVSFDSYDLILKSPGVPFSKILKKYHNKIVGQASLFLKWYGDQTIGVTGTKGKSTCSSLCFHLLKEGGMNALLGGNIGVPLFDLIPKMKKDTWVVAELSCHQLFNIDKSPHISILLNLFEEHLDYYKSVDEYFRSKVNIFKHQTEDDVLIYNFDDSEIKKYLDEVGHARLTSYSMRNAKADFRIVKDKLSSKLLKGKDKAIASKLLGKINYYNIMPAIAVANEVGLSKTKIFEALKSFKPLAHRLEDLGIVDGVKFVNDSISTIPQSCIAAVKAIGKVGTLILGGQDRGIDYDPLIQFLVKKKINNLVFFDKSGLRMYESLLAAEPQLETTRNVFVTDDFKKVIKFCLFHTKSGQVCLLSPASPSYGKFNNFIDRGNKFKSLILEISQAENFES